MRAAVDNNSSLDAGESSFVMGTCGGTSVHMITTGTDKEIMLGRVTAGL